MPNQLLKTKKKKVNESIDKNKTRLLFSFLFSLF